MGPYDDISICLHADGKHCQTASTRFAELHDVHWHQPPGAPHAMVHGYIACADTIPMVYAERARRADRQRTFSFGDQPIGIRAVTHARGL